MNPIVEIGLDSRIYMEKIYFRNNSHFLEKPRTDYSLVAADDGREFDGRAATVLSFRAVFFFVVV